jgi:deoxycytidylate deaminase
MLDLAIQVAKDNDVPKFKFGAVITTKKGSVVSIGKNSYVKTHPTQSRYGARHTNEAACFIHAELSAILRAKGKGHTLWVARVKKTGEIGMSHPCPSCMAIIKNETNLKRVIYTINDNEYGVWEV